MSFKILPYSFFFTYNFHIQTATPLQFTGQECKELLISVTSLHVSNFFNLLLLSLVPPLPRIHQFERKVQTPSHPAITSLMLAWPAFIWHICRSCCIHSESLYSTLDSLCPVASICHPVSVSTTCSGQGQVTGSREGKPEDNHIP